ncbi:MAG: CHAT domain-containing protein [Elainellaceae cyanobacterium]
MPLFEIPCLSLAIARLQAADPEHYAIWVLRAPSPEGYVHYDRLWTDSLTQAWQAWHNMFVTTQDSDGMSQSVFNIDASSVLPPVLDSADAMASGQTTSYSSRLMQYLGVSLWQWLFDGPIQGSFRQSQGIAIGQGRPLRLRLEIRDPNLISLPWEIMQPEPGKQAVSLSQQILFSRTTSAVDPLPPLRADQSLNILLVLGQDEAMTRSSADVSAAKSILELEQEAETLTRILEQSTSRHGARFDSPMLCSVTTLVQPTEADLIDQLETRDYNVLFYSGHGEAAPSGGLLFLRSDATINGTELAQVLTRCQVKLAVFNACWGAQSDRTSQDAIPRSSLAEVLIHHGVPAVLAMRDSIADREALSFIEVFAQALVERSSVDRAVAIARQHLLTLYKFNQPAWTLPVLYMHPEFNGELIRPLSEGVTEIPANSSTWIGRNTPAASIRSLGSYPQVWRIQGGIMRVGKWEGNDLVLHDPGVSRKHAEIFYRDTFLAGQRGPSFYLRDFSRFGTLVLGADGWQKVHRQEVQLQSKTQLKFGSSQSQVLEFVIDGSTPSTQT